MGLPRHVCGPVKAETFMEKSNHFLIKLTPNSINEGWVARCITGSRRKPNPIILLNSQVNRQPPQLFA